MTNKKNILVIGSGLAGSCLAHQLLRQGHRVTIIDKGENFATSVAAGMVNPMVFRRMNKSWRLDEFLPQAKEFYQSLEKLLEIELIHTITIRRLFSSKQERESWITKQELPEFENYLTALSEEDDQYSGASNQFGSGRIKNAFWVDSQKFYQSHLAFFEKEGILLRESFSLGDFNPTQGLYKGEKFDQIVFCCGYLNKQLPFFETLPVEQTKGQTLTISSNEIAESESLNRKCFVLPIGNHKFRIGSTYEWQNESLDVTEEGRQSLLENLGIIGDFKIDILTQNAGIRPTVLDRRPILGQHPEFPKLFIFNGLGTKGYLMAPTLSRELTCFMSGSATLNSDISLERFNKPKNSV